MADEIALIYATSEGQTRKISDYIAGQLQQRGYATELHDGRALSKTFELAGYDGIIVGASIHAGKFPKSITGVIRQHHNVFEDLPAAFFSVGLLASLESPGEGSTTRRLVDEFLEEVRWEPMMIESFAGAIPFSQYGFFRRMIMKFILNRRVDEKVDASKDYEYTDWSRVDEFVKRYDERFEELTTGIQTATDRTQGPS